MCILALFEPTGNKAIIRPSSGLTLLSNSNWLSTRATCFGDLPLMYAGSTLAGMAWETTGRHPLA